MQIGIQAKSYTLIGKGKEYQNLATINIFNKNSTIKIIKSSKNLWRTKVLFKGAL